MRKLLKRRNVQKWRAIFKEGRRMFPKPEFANVTYLGNGLYSAKEGVAVNGITIIHGATWG